MRRFHPLHTTLSKPERFTWPFCYEPHPLCLLAAEEVKREIARIEPSEGKMFGVLVVDTDEGLGFLAAYSGLLEGRNDWEYFVPPVYDAQQPDGYFKTREREIMQAEEHKQMSQELQIWLFRQYRLLNAKGEVHDLVEIWNDYHSAPRIREKFPLPPGGTGDCCAPKLLQYAYQQGFQPVCMAEFWWGDSPKGIIRHHNQYYPACRGKCLPVLTWMLQGLQVDPDPDKEPHARHDVEIVYEDEALAVVNKPPGMLSAPGRTEHYSVATWAQERWPGSMIVHRLDMMTSGLLIVAKTAESYHHLQDQFTARTVKKKYLALVEGTPRNEHGVIDLPLSSDPMNRPLQMVDTGHGKRAITEYRILHSGQHSLLALWPHTGRTHQLRVHCAHPDGLGCPIVGDELYGKKADRLYLQAQAISFINPSTGKWQHIELTDILNIKH